ncbi:MAG: Outer membrane protein assembly factor BamD [Holosporales bacterium]
MGMYLKKSLAIVGIIFAAGCSSDEINYADQKPQDIYSQANVELKKKDFKKAAKIFSEIERNYPYSDYAINGQLLSAYSLYMAGSFDESSEAFNVFIQLHPGHAEVPYALYMRGVCAFEQIPLIERDQTCAQESITFFEELIERYPDSKYVKDAKQKRAQIKDHLAAKEMEIGIYYMNVYSYVAAINRFKTVVNEYKEARQLAEAYYRLVEAYKALGIPDQSVFYCNLLNKNFKDNVWTTKANNLMNSSQPISK